MEDIAAATVKFKSGALGIIEGNTAAYPGYSVTIDVFGEKGSVIIENDTLKEWNIKNEKTTKKTTNSNDNGSSSSTQKWVLIFLTDVNMKDIIDTIINHQQPLVNGKESIKSL